MATHGGETQRRHPALRVLAALAFIAVATLNSAGYRFGAGDQAFYLPAIQRHLEPDSFPRDRVVIDDQDRLNVFPRVAAVLVGNAGLPQPAFFLGLYLFKSVWLVAHVAAIFMGEAAFALACGVGILYLVQENSIKTKKLRFFFKRLPSLDLLDSTGYGCIVVGFTLLTIGLITGLVYAKSVWGRFWSWDPKEVWSGISWLFYAALLHERLTVGWRGRRSAIMAIVGFGVLVFTFLGVNLFMEGHHVQFTK